MRGRSSGRRPRRRRPTTSKRRPSSKAAGRSGTSSTPTIPTARTNEKGRQSEMTRFVALTLALVIATAVSAPGTGAQQSEVTAEEVVAALEAAYGVHHGQRRNHAKGTCALGTFVGMSAAAAYSRSALFSGSPVPVVARCSLARGNPEASDAERSPRGMALEFRLLNGDLQHITMINTPTFFAAMPRTFLDKMRALRRDPATGKPDPEALEAFGADRKSVV